MNQSRGKRWCCTINEYGPEFIEKLKEEFKNGTLEKFVCQEERGEQDGFVHLQLFLAFKASKRFAQVKEFVGNSAHVELAKGNDRSNYNYCTKEATRTGEYREERGTFDGGQGSRSDLSRVVAAVEEKKTLSEIATQNPIEFIKFHRGIERLVEITRERNAPKHRDMCVIVLCGQSGTGKSLWVRLYAERHGFGIYNKPIGLGSGVQWFDGYDGEEVLLLDDFEWGQVPIRELLIWCDVYKHKVAVKGAFVNAGWHTVCITSNFHPQEWYAQTLITAEQRRPLDRRLDHIFTGVELPRFFSDVFPVTERRVGRIGFAQEEKKEE